MKLIENEEYENIEVIEETEYVLFPYKETILTKESDNE